MHAAAAAVRLLWGAYTSVICISIPSPLTRLPSGALRSAGETVLSKTGQTVKRSVKTRPIIRIRFYFTFFKQLSQYIRYVFFLGSRCQYANEIKCYALLSVLLVSGWGATGRKGTQFLYLQLLTTRWPNWNIQNYHRQGTRNKLTVKHFSRWIAMFTTLEGIASN